MKGSTWFVAAVGVTFTLAACSKPHDAGAAAVPHGAADTMTVASAGPGAVPPQTNCGHAVCADNFFIDAAPAQCTAGSACTVTLKLVATGDFHINDEYPYRFRADDAPGVEFLGTDATGKNAFSKAAGDWTKSEEKSGAMAVKFVPADRPGVERAKTIAGTFKLSVCSAQSCLLEQRLVTASIAAR